MSEPWRMVVRRHGGPEVLERETYDPGQPGPGELLVAHEAIGLNFIDTYVRSGLYDAPLPTTPGVEAVGTVVAVGLETRGFKPGDRVGSVSAPGAYASHRIIAASKAVRIPDDIASEQAAATLMKGFTACYLAEYVIPLAPGQTALIHSAAGGVGSILVPWLRDRGVIVIAHAGSAKKAATVIADHSLSGDFATLGEHVRSLTGGKGVDVVYDGVGKDSWDASLAALRPRGLMVSYGNASGPVPPVAPLDLMRRGSLFLTRPTLADYIATPEALADAAGLLFDRMRRGVVKAVIGQRFALADAAEAHRALEARRTTGSTVLLPWRDGQHGRSGRRFRRRPSRKGRLRGSLPRSSSAPRKR